MQGSFLSHLLHNQGNGFTTDDKNNYSTPVGAQRFTDLHYSGKASAVRLQMSLFVILLQTDVFGIRLPNREIFPPNCVLDKIYTG